MELNWTDINIATSTMHDAMIELHILTNDNMGDDVPRCVFIKMSRANAKWLRDALDAAVKLNKLKGE